MKILEENFISKGFEHKQIEREGDLAIYKRNRVGSDKFHYEVIVIKDHPAYTISGVTIEAGETYPSATHFGVYGWSCPTLADAQIKFNKLKKDKNEKRKV